MHELCFRASPKSSGPPRRQQALIGRHDRLPLPQRPLDQRSRGGCATDQLDNDPRLRIIDRRLGVGCKWKIRVIA